MADPMAFPLNDIHAAIESAYTAAAMFDLDIIVLGASHGHARDGFSAFRWRAVREGWEGVSFRSVNGDESIQLHHGGRVRLGSVGHSSNAPLADAVFAPAGLSDEQAFPISRLTRHRSYIEYGE